MKVGFKESCLLVGVAVLVGCGDKESNTFTLVGELPPDFYYTAVAWYVPDPREICAITDWRRTMPSFNKQWRKRYDSAVVIEVRKVIKGCQMVLGKLELEILGVYGSQVSQVSYDVAGIGVYQDLEEGFKRVMASESEDVFFGRCEWFFRTMGRERQIRKILDCKKDVARGERGRGKVYAVYSADQLPGRTVRMNVRLDEKEPPYFSDAWLEFPAGWRTCLGKGEEDARGCCRGNSLDFSKFVMPDGRVCSVYPGCTD